MASILRISTGARTDSGAIPLKNGTTKVSYAGAGNSGEAREEPEQPVWAWFEAANTPEQIAGRLVIALAAAHWALDYCRRWLRENRYLARIEG